jgi:hypothetical protein
MVSQRFHSVLDEALTGHYAASSMEGVVGSVSDIMGHYDNRSRHLKRPRHADDDEEVALFRRVRVCVQVQKLFQKIRSPVSMHATHCHFLGTL